MAECGRVEKIAEGWIQIRLKRWLGLRKKRVYGAVLKCTGCGVVILREQNPHERTPKTHPK